MRALLAACLLATLAGCASAPPPTPLGPPPPAGAGPALAVAPFALRYEPSAARPRQADGALEPFAPPYRPALDLAALRERVGALLRERGGYRSVALLPPGKETSSPELREAARRAGARWLLEVWLEDAGVRLRGRNGLTAFKVVVLIVSSILIFPAVDPLNWFLPGEDYELTWYARFRVSEVDGGAERAAGYLELGAWDSFAAFPPAPTRGWFILGFLRAPGCLGEEHWQEIAEQLEDRARAELERGLVTAVEGPCQAKER
ncbi:MAG: hypothetical protein AB7N76_00860 [Planctomycetota bacterium]